MIHYDSEIQVSLPLLLLPSKETWTSGCKIALWQGRTLVVVRPKNIYLRARKRWGESPSSKIREVTYDDLEIESHIRVILQYTHQI